MKRLITGIFNKILIEVKWRLAVEIPSVEISTSWNVNDRDVTGYEIPTYYKPINIYKLGVI